MVAVLCWGDIHYVEGDNFGNVPSLALATYGGRPIAHGDIACVPVDRFRFRLQRIRFAPSLARVNRRFSPARAGNTHSTRSSGCCSTLQPRTRGEHPVTDRECTRFFASAPHARGTRGVHRVRLVADRFSPARAGNTIPCRTRITCCSLQPRTRGEHC